MRTPEVRLALAFFVLALVALPVLAQKTTAPPSATPAAGGTFKNLKVLPKDIPPAQLRAAMAEISKALGVRCDHCHVRAVAGQPIRDEDYALDDKKAKLVARQMMLMTRDINEKYLAGLEQHQDPPNKVECVTCHHGTTQPRTLQAVLRTAYDTGGLDSARARYRSLRDRYYGRAAYDFSDAALGDVGTALAQSGHGADAESLLVLNVAMNPSSTFAPRQWAHVTIANGFRKGAAEGATSVQLVRSRLGAEGANEEALIAIGYQLLGRKETPAALVAFQFVAAEHPQSGNAWDSLGEAYLQSGDRKRAREAYEKALKLDPKNDNARQKLKEIKNARKS